MTPQPKYTTNLVIKWHYSGYCNQKGFTSGEQYDYYMAWTIFGPCNDTLAPTADVPTAYPGGIHQGSYNFNTHSIWMDYQHQEVPSWGSIVHHCK
jgi:hypothetical protein